MAGRGSRLRPHTITVPKPLIPVAGKPMVQRLVEGLIKMSAEKVENIGFVIGDFGDEVENQLKAVAKELGATGHIFYQDKPLGTAHAILCAEPLITGKTLVAFADTLFDADYIIDTEQDGVIVVQKVEDPSAFGVVQLSEDGYINNFVEKPETFVSDLAIIGIYYFKDGDFLKKEMQYLLDNDIKDKGEYQLTNALENMKQKGTKFATGQVNEWLDCGNKNATVYTNQRVLELLEKQNPENQQKVVDSLNESNSVLIQPCFVGKNVQLLNSVVGPHVSIGENTHIENSVIKNTIIQANSTIKNKVIENSMIGNHVTVNGKSTQFSIGDYTILES